LVSALVPGFRVSGFWTAFFASIVMTLLSLAVSAMIFGSGNNPVDVPLHQGVLI
jgi:putative membrane protein